MAKILVIGATGLIGSAVASALAARNEVIKAARTPADGVEAVDISKPDSIASLFARIGTVDGIICAAGSAPMVPWSDVTTQVLMAGLGGKFADQANVIIGGYPHVTPGGSITVTTGVLAEHPMPGSAVTTTANSALAGLVRAAALELQGSVRVNAVSPGWVSETLAKLGRDPSEGMPAALVADVYVEALDVDVSGHVLDADAILLKACRRHWWPTSMSRRWTWTSAATCWTP